MSVTFGFGLTTSGRTPGGLMMIQIPYDDRDALNNNLKIYVNVICVHVECMCMHVCCVCVHTVPTEASQKWVTDALEWN